MIVLWACFHLIKSQLLATVGVGVSKRSSGTQGSSQCHGGADAIELCQGSSENRQLQEEKPAASEM